MLKLYTQRAAKKNSAERERTAAVIQAGTDDAGADDVINVKPDMPKLLRTEEIGGKVEPTRFGWSFYAALRELDREDQIVTWLTTTFAQDFAPAYSSQNPTCVRALCD